MKYLFFISVLLYSYACFAQRFPEIPAKEYGIREARIHSEWGNHKRKMGTKKAIVQYNKFGKPVKLTEVFYDVYNHEKDSLIMLYVYEDTLLTKLSWKEYHNGRLSDKGEERTTYSFDNFHKVAQQTIDDHGRITKELYLVDSIHHIYTTEYYDNDSSVYVPARKGYDYLRGTQLKLSRRFTEYYDEWNILRRSSDCLVNCKWKNMKDSSCCTFIDYTRNRDTFFTRTSNYNSSWGWKTLQHKKYVTPDGSIYQSSTYDNASLLYEDRLKNGLLKSSKQYEIEGRGRFYERTVNYSYKFY